MGNASDRLVGKIKTHILFSVKFSPENLAVYEIMWKNTAGQVTDGNMAHSHCMLEKEMYRNTLRICNVYCFSTAKMVTRRRLNERFYVNYLSCFVLTKHRNRTSTSSSTYIRSAL